MTGGDAVQVCATAGPLGCAQGIQVSGVELASLSGDVVEEPWGRWSLDRYRIEGSLVDAGVIATSVAEILPEMVEVDAFIEVVGGSVADLPDMSRTPAGVPPPAPDASDLFVVCERFPVDLAVFDTVADDHLDDHPSARAFRQNRALILRDPQTDTDVVDEPWWRLYDKGDNVLYATGDPAVHLRTARLERRSDDVWFVAGSGGCQLTRGAAGLEEATWRLDPATPPTPESRSIAVLVLERACNSGQPPGDRLHAPLIEATDSTVTITFFVTPNTGNHECPGNPEVPITIPLDARLGSRHLLDGRTHPPSPPRTEP